MSAGNNERSAPRRSNVRGPAGEGDTDMAKNSKFAIEGSINGQWSRAHVGDVNDTTLFDSEDEAAEAINDLVGETHTTYPVVMGWTYETLRVVEVAS